MSVSAGSGGLDLDTIVSGGAAFVQRLAEFQIAAAAYKKSLDDLNLGQSAQQAYDEAQALLAQARRSAAIRLVPRRIRGYGFRL